MSDKLLEIKDLHAGVEDKEILKGLSLSIGKGEVHVILGPNGSGKSTLMNVIMGHPKYEVTGGSLDFEGESIKELPTFERARRGLFLSFQTPEEIPGITLGTMIRTSMQAVSGKKVKLLPFRKELKARLEELKMKPEYAERYLNVARDMNPHNPDVLNNTGLKMSQKSYASLNEAFDALANGEVDYVLCEAYPGAYLASLHKGIGFAGSLEVPVTSGVAVLTENAALATQVQTAFDTISQNGILQLVVLH